MSRKSSKMDDFKSAIFLLEDRFYVVKYEKLIWIWKTQESMYQDTD